MIREQLSRIIEQRRTILGVGPMSTNCIDAAIELSNENRIPVLLIASRRQIDSEEFGGGYVNNWCTDQLTEYVFARDYGGKVILCRDHGGPWQSEKEKQQNMGLRNAMESAKLSYLRDIEAGMQILHIDPSVDIHLKPTMLEIIDRVLELYEYCWQIADRNHKKVEFEIGTEEQSGSTSSAIEFEDMIKQINRYCCRNHMPQPLFVVVQNGTKVQETRNIGSFDLPVRVADEVPPEIHIPLMSSVCKKNGVYIKAHNTDYLSEESLRWYPRLGIHAANIAPEYGVAETRALISILENCDMKSERDYFLELSYQSHKWEKWMSENTTATDMDKAIIAGHYIFSVPEVVIWKEKIISELDKKGISLDECLKNAIKSIMRMHLRDFRML